MTAFRTYVCALRLLLTLCTTQLQLEFNRLTDAAFLLSVRLCSARTDTACEARLSLAFCIDGSVHRIFQRELEGYFSAAPASWHGTTRVGGELLVPDHHRRTAILLGTTS